MMRILSTDLRFYGLTTFRIKGLEGQKEKPHPNDEKYREHYIPWPV
ncbi:MAG: hypothetical protein V5A76_07540 [Candidatus Thermoplasmatota archaeon]